MSFLQILLIGVSLSMDAMAVSVSNSLAYAKCTRAKKLAMPLFFGLFQFAMPVVGYFAAGFLKDFISGFSRYLIFAIFFILGGKMLYEAVKELAVTECIYEPQKDLTYKMLVVQAVATSIDAFAIGVGFVAEGMDILSMLWAAGIIGLVTVVICLGAVFVGRRFGTVLGGKAQILGGIILIILAVKALF